MRLVTFVVCFAFVSGCYGPTAPDERFLRAPSPPPPPPPPPSIVSGVVTDSLQHNPLSGAYVHWAWSAFGCGDPAGSASTGDDGTYSLKVGSNGAVLGQQVEVIVCASKDGYKAHQESVRVTMDASEVTVNFDLMRSDGSTMARR